MADDKPTSNPPLKFQVGGAFYSSPYTFLALRSCFSVCPEGFFYVTTSLLYVTTSLLYVTTSLAAAAKSTLPVPSTGISSTFSKVRGSMISATPAAGAA